MVAGRWRRLRRFRQIYKRFHAYTMIPQDIFVDNLLVADRLLNRPGCVVECGVWRGGMSAGIASVLGDDRRYFLFDSFEGLPPAKSIDGEAALAWQKNTTSATYYDNCKAPAEYAQRAMTLAGARSFQLIKGWFNDTVRSFVPPEPIALLRLDGDWYESTHVCLEALFQYVCPGGLIIIDDYYTWDGCSRALHDFLSSRGLPDRIRSFGSVCALERTSARVESKCR